jgi:hypothetical protein
MASLWLGWELGGCLLIPFGLRRPRDEANGQSSEVQRGVSRLPSYVFSTRK